MFFPDKKRPHGNAVMNAPSVREPERFALDPMPALAWWI